MSKCLRILAITGLFILVPLAGHATNLTGTFKHPDGSMVNGKLILRLSNPAKLSDNSAQIVPLVKIFPVTNGQLEAGAFVYGNDVLVPAGTHYVARLVDENNNLLFEQKWAITGTNLDLGTLTPTTAGIVLADPLVRNVTTSQVVQGPVTFTSPLTVFGLTVNGHLHPGSAGFYTLGNPTLPWLEIHAERWNGNVNLGSSTGFVPTPASAPSVAVESTTGGSMDNATRYYRVTLITLNGETPPSPVATFTPSTCSAGTCRIRVQLSGDEWREGAFAYRVYASSDNVTFHRQSGFPEELETTGAMANAHYSPGDVLLNSLTFSGPQPPGVNTAAIDADQVALNSVCNSQTGGFQRCYGTLRYKQNPAGGFAQTGTTPLVVARPARIEGHSNSSVDDVTSGSTRSCAFASTKLGCVMVMTASGVSIRGLHVSSASNGYMLHTWPSSLNQIEIGDATVSTSGALPVAPLRIRGIWYYLRFPNLQLHANTTGTGANKGAGVLISNAAGANWLFSGPVRWTIRDNNDAIRNDKGKTDADRGASTAFPTWVGQFQVRDVQVQWGPTGSGQGQLARAEGLGIEFDGVTHSDYAPASGTGPLIELGADADGAAACCRNLRIENSSFLNGHANNSDLIKVTGASGFWSLHVRNAQMAHVNALNLNGVSIAGGIWIMGTNTPNCSAGASNSRIVNASATQSIQCAYAANNGIPADRVANLRVTGGLGIFSDGNIANSKHFYWTGTADLVASMSDPTVAANRYFLLQGNAAGSKNVVFLDSTGTLPLLRVNQALDRLEADGNFLPVSNNTRDLGTGSLRWRNGYFASALDVSVATGTPPLVIASTTEVANLNAQKWHGRNAIDFSGSLDFASIPAQACSELSITATGAATGSSIAAAWPAALESGLAGTMRVSAANTVAVRLCNVTSSAVDPASATFAGRVIQ